MNRLVLLICGSVRAVLFTNLPPFKGDAMVHLRNRLSAKLAWHSFLRSLPHEIGLEPQKEVSTVPGSAEQDDVTLGLQQP